ncbi:MAG: phosphate ABC transporter permease PstA [Dehalococcoidia bacterium]|nr:phosphate ABC transporter permease PstA [Dehalococcoidia bacterium]
MITGTDRNLGKRRRKGQVSHAIFLAATMVGIVALSFLLGDVARKGIGWLDWQFLTSLPSRFPERSGISSALWGSIWLIGLTALFSLTIGVGTAIYLEEYARRGWLTRAIQTNISNLAGVPSIVYGILGLAAFVRAMSLGRSVMAGALTMTLLILPIIIVASQEAIRAVPRPLRDASFALGATRWQTVRRVVLPAAAPGILTGIILALARALGEAAPLIMIGALMFVPFVPTSPLDQFSVLPIQIFNWTARPQPEFRLIAAAAIIVLLVVLLMMNAAAVLLRNKYQKRAEE